ncbi:cuticle protein 12.5-like [Hermetia illucens]|uniref:cuticle protein 12.5-like n=1 Tax=Hermetia illucens TaxID=343691 RepID=UPI0018CC4CFA|nr:cuticle protein 12.5-like [Hermetia illucens]
MKFVILALALIGAASAGYITPYTAYSTPVVGAPVVGAPVVGAPLAYSAPGFAAAPVFRSAVYAAPAVAGAPLAYSAPIATTFHGSYAAPVIDVLKKRAAA